MKCSNIICVFFVSTILAVYKCDNDKRNPEATAKVIEAVQTTCGKESQKLGKLIHENRVTLRKQEAVCECFGNYRACLQKEGVIPRRLGSFYASVIELKNMLLAKIVVCRDFDLGTCPLLACSLLHLLCF
uniref:Uncharacterized protein n=1 Tax=Ditylenchus dipsaci TaxID=166011 RepID=A0A915DUT1_9BILA